MLSCLSGVYPVCAVTSKARRTQRRNHSVRHACSTCNDAPLWFGGVCLVILLRAFEPGCLGFLMCQPRKCSFLTTEVVRIHFCNQQLRPLEETHEDLLVTVDWTGLSNELQSKASSSWRRGWFCQNKQKPNWKTSTTSSKIEYLSHLMNVHVNKTEKIMLIY